MNNNFTMNTVTPQFYLNSDNEVDFNNRVIELLDKDPLMAIPANFIGKIQNIKDDVFTKIQDRLNIKLEDLLPNEDDIEIITVEVMGTVPVIGLMMQNVFILISNKLKRNQSGEIITKETIKNMVDIEIAKIKNELINIIKDKLEQSTVDEKVKLCEKGYDGIKESHLESLYERLTYLKLKLSKKEIPDKNDSLLVGIRSQFDSLRKSLKILLSFTHDQVIIQNAPNLCVQIMGMYILTLNNLIYHWYQYGFNPRYARGIPANDEESATHSFREKLHINIQKFLKQVQIASCTFVRIYEDVSLRRGDDETFEKNKKELYNIKYGTMENLDKIFEADPFYYPIPLIKEYELIFLKTFNKIKIQTSKKKGPCIFRIDGQHFSNVSQNIDELKSKDCDLMTKCYGKYFTSSPSCIEIELDESKDIRIRCLYGHMKDDNPKMMCLVDNDKKESKGDYEVFPPFSVNDYTNFDDDLVYGFFTTESYGKKDNFFLQVHLYVQLSKLTFCEIIVTD